MITVKTGNIFNLNTQAIVNPVNTVGVMGKGLALQFKRRYPANFNSYAQACRNNNLTTGKLHVTKQNGKYIINFPTKQHWRNSSRLIYVITGLKALRKLILNQNIQSIAIPPLGCGLGGLDFHTVRKHIEAELDNLDCNIIIINNQ